MNAIHCHSSEDMHHLSDESVHLIVTSPPYNAGIEYDEHNDMLAFDEYRSMLRRVWKECFRVLVDGGRIAVNVMGTGLQPYIPLQAFVTVDMLTVGFLMRTQIAWHKGCSQKLTAWGSWKSASNPMVLDDHEYILVFSKMCFKRREKGRINYQQKRIYAEYQIVLADRTGVCQAHRASRPVPVELPRRLIQLYSFKDDVVLDPFMGSGTTLVAAKELDRQWVAYDISPAYCELANQRLRQEYLL